MVSESRITNRYSKKQTLIADRNFRFQLQLFSRCFALNVWVYHNGVAYAIIEMHKRLRICSVFVVI